MNLSIFLILLLLSSGLLYSEKPKINSDPSLSCYVISPFTLEFKDIKYGMTKDTSLVITAFGREFNIQAICKNPDIKIDPSEFTIKPNESKTITISYTPSEILHEDSIIDFHSNNIANDVYYRCINQDYKLLKPNGGEKLNSDSNYTIEWLSSQETITKIEFSSDAGNSWNLVSDSQNSTQYLWENIPKVVSDSCLMKISQPTDKNIFVSKNVGMNIMSFIACNSNGTKLAVNTPNRLFILDTKTGKIVKDIDRNIFIGNSEYGPGLKIKWAYNDELLVTTNYSSPTKICLWNYKLENLASMFELESFKNIDFFIVSHDGKKIAVCFSSKELKIFEIDKYGEQYYLKGKLSIASDSSLLIPNSWSPDDKSILSSYAALIDVNTGEIINHHKDLDNHYNNFQLSPDGQKIFAMSSWNLTIFESNNFDSLLSTPINFSPWYRMNKAKWNHNSDKIAIIGEHDSILIWDININKQKKYIGHSGKKIDPAQIYDIDWINNNNFISLSNEDELFNWNLENNTYFVYKNSGHHRNISDLYYDHSKDIIISISHDQTLRKWDPISMEEIGAPIEFQHSLYSIDKHPFEDIFVIGIGSGILIIDSKTYEIIKELDLKKEGILAKLVKFSPNGDKIVVGVPYLLINYPTMDSIKSIIQKSGYTPAICWLPDGKTILFNEDVYDVINHNILMKLKDTINDLPVDVKSILLDTNKKRIIIFGYNGTYEFNSLTLKMISKKQNSTGYGIFYPSLSPDQSQILTSSGYIISIIDANTFDLELRYIGFPDYRSDLMWLPSGKEIVACNENGNMKKLEIRNNQKSDISDNYWSIINLNKTKDTVRVIIYFENDSAYSGEERNLKLKVSQNLADTNIALPKTFRAKVAWQKSILAANSDEYYILDDSTYIDIVAEYDNKNNLLYNIPVTAGLGSVEKSDLRIVDFEWLNLDNDTIQFVNEYKNGRFNILGICYDGGARLINTNNNVMFYIKPNPSNTFVELNINFIEDGYSEVYITNEKGIVVKKVFSGLPNINSKDFKFETNDLSSGFYYIIIKTPTIYQSQKLEIIK